MPVDLTGSIIKMKNISGDFGEAQLVNVKSDTYIFWNGNSLQTYFTMDSANVIKNNKTLKEKENK